MAPSPEPPAASPEPPAVSPEPAAAAAEPTTAPELPAKAEPAPAAASAADQPPAARASEQQAAGAAEPGSSQAQALASLKELCDCGLLPVDLYDENVAAIHRSSQRLQQWRGRLRDKSERLSERHAAMQVSILDRVNNGRPRHPVAPQPRARSDHGRRLSFRRPTRMCCARARVAWRRLPIASSCWSSGR